MPCIKHLKAKINLNNIQKSVSSSRYTHCVFIGEVNQLGLLREVIGVCSKNLIKYINSVCGYNAHFAVLKPVVSVVTIML